jgi:hypothetical protein
MEFELNITPGEQKIAYLSQFQKSVAGGYVRDMREGESSGIGET